MEQVRCTNCGSASILPDGTGEFCTCEACGSVFSVARGTGFAKVELDHTQDIRAWREYLAKQYKLQIESTKARDYSGVKLFAQKILSVLPDDFRALYFSALADRYNDNDNAFIDFLKNAKSDGVSPDERKDVVDSLVATVEPKYLDITREFLARLYPQNPKAFDSVLERNVKLSIQRIKYARAAERDVFICHRTAAPDQDIADAICTRLEERGLRCWIAPRNILAGSQNYERDMIKGVENSSVFLLVTSFKSIYSEDCEMELKAAVLAGKTLYSYRIDDTPYDGTFEKALSSVQWLDATDDPFAHLEQLVIDIKGILARDEHEKVELEEKRLAAREMERQQAEKTRTREQERIDRLERIVAGGGASSTSEASLKSKLKRAEIELSSGNFDRAERIIDGVLDCDPENALAWWLMMLCELRVRSDTELVNSGKDYTAHSYYKNAERFADEEFGERLDRVEDVYRNTSVRTLNAALDEAEMFLRTEDFESLKKALAKIEISFEDEDSLVFKKFPDIASRFFWYKLWAKYGQTKLVCVEDITREREYKLAVKYALPAQQKEYEDARATVSKNAVMFLRERSKSRLNDSKLADYLVDNKNILPADIYEYYSSMLYFRKMLLQLNMTEAQLYASALDICTNEYYMLATSIATDAQKEEYKRLEERLEENRAAQKRREWSEKHRYEPDRERGEKSIRIRETAVGVMSAIAGMISYIFLLVLIIALGDEWGHTFELLMIAAISRLVLDIINVGSTGGRTFTMSTINLIANISTILYLIAYGFETDFSPASIVINVISIVIEGINLSRSGKNLQRY